MRSIFLAAMGAGIIIFAAAGAFFVAGYLVERPYAPAPLEAKHLTGSGAEIQTIHIPRGIGSGKIGELLEEKGIIRHRYLFYYYLWRYGRSDHLQAGEYELSGAMTIPEIVGKLTRGDVVEHGKKVTIPEGLTFDEIEAKLQEAGFSFLALDSEMKKFNIREGYLFPDTYFFDKEATGEDVVKKMHENFLAKIEPLKSTIAESGRTLDEIVIMASLIEEEIPHEEDRPTAAGILWKRLGAGMPLQVDATVLYAKGIRGGTGERRILTREDLALDSPYNTYRSKGLPPGAIANPGLGALRAALFPRESDYWYYLSRPDGATVFSKTIEKHNAAKRKYLR